MKKLFALLSICVSLYATAQNDTISIQPGATDMLFYNVTNHTKTAADNTDWHIAFAVRPAIPPYNTNQAAAIRINEAWGLELYRSPNQRLSSWNTFDTTGWQSWQRMHNPDTTWTIGAFNVNKDFGNDYNYGWGAYSFGVHSVIGDSSVYLLHMPDGSFQKFAILNLQYDTAFNVRYAKLDNSGDNIAEIRKKPYNTKSFVYYNIDTRTIMDKEPALTDWDMVFLRYGDTTYSASDLTSDIGVLTNDAVTTHKATDAELAGNCYTGTDFSKYINVIGKLANVNIDSNAYTIQRTNNPGTYNRIIFTQFDGSYTGMTYFNTNMCALTGVNDVTTLGNITAYPVPASDVLQVRISGDQEASGSLTIVDLSGRTLISQAAVIRTGENNFTVNTSALQSGNYILSLSTEAGKVNRMVSVVR